MVPMDNLIVKNSKIKLVGLLLASIVFVVAGIWIAQVGSPGKGIVGYICASFFALGIPVSLFQIFDHRPKLVIDSLGIDDKRWGIGKIPWSEITNFNVRNIETQEFLCLYLENEEKYLKKLSKFQRKIVDVNKTLNFPPFCISISQLNLDSNEIKSLVAKYLKVK